MIFFFIVISFAFDVNIHIIHITILLDAEKCEFN